MHQIIVAQFVTLDGVTDDPDGSGGTPHGGWAFQPGSVAMAPDPFRLGERYEHGVILLGRRSSQMLAGIFPHRDDPFARRLTATRKLVASRSADGVAGWPDASPLTGALPEELERLRARQDVVVLGSGEIVAQLVAHDLVDQYRLLVFPTVLGTGRRVFDNASTPFGLRLVSSEDAGDGVLRQVYDRRRAA